MHPFRSDLVLNMAISESTLKAFSAGFDQNKFRLQPLVDVIRKVIPEFSLGYYEGKSTPLELVVEKLKKAAELVYLTDKYKSRGEFGELILHLLLRDYCNTIPLVSKIYFRDSHNVPIHGFDGIHVTADGSNKYLWLGESKLYSSGDQGIADLLADIRKHVNEDYLRKEFALIQHKLHTNVPEIEYWRNLIHPNQLLENVFNGIIIPMACTFTSDIFKKHSDNTKHFLDDFKNECLRLNGKFRKDIKTSVQIILLLLPVPDKDELNTELDKRLKSMQAI